MTLFARAYLLLAIVLVTLILTIAYYLDLPEGWPRLAVFGGCVLLFGLICYFGNRAQRP